MKSWLNQLAPSIAPTVPRASLGAGLGCWIEHEDEPDEVGRKGGVSTHERAGIWIAFFQECQK